MELKVMIVEDDDTMRALLNTLLKMEGYSVIQGLLIDQASLLNQIRHEMPMIILMDVNLHNLNGLDILKELQSDQRTNTIKILMTSGMDTQDQCIKAGAKGFLLKPYMPTELLSWFRANIN